MSVASGAGAEAARVPTTTLPSRACQLGPAKWIAAVSRPRSRIACGAFSVQAGAPPAAGVAQTQLCVPTA